MDQILQSSVETDHTKHESKVILIKATFCIFALANGTVLLDLYHFDAG